MLTSCTTLGYYHLNEVNEEGKIINPKITTH